MDAKGSLGAQTLYSITARVLSPFSFNGKQWEEGEVFCFLEEAQAAVFQEQKDHVSATGGFDNRPHVFWDTTKEVSFAITDGTFTESSFAIFSGATAIKPSVAKEFSFREELQSDETGFIKLKHTPVGKGFIYNRKTGEKLFSGQLTKEVITDKILTPVIVDYRFTTQVQTEVLVGRQILGFLSLEARMRIKDDKDGLIRTAIIQVPKFKLVSDFSLRLGRAVSPVTVAFSGIAIPVGERNNSRSLSISFLEDDVDSDF